MTYDYVGNFGPPDVTSNDSDVNKKAIASYITFPDVSGIAPSSPNKTGTASRPVLSKEMTLYLSATGTAQANLAVWNSSGTLLANSFTIFPTAGTTPDYTVQTITNKIFYSGTKYYVGFAKQSTGTFYWSGTSATSADVNYSNTYPDFNKKGSVGFSGELSWSLGVSTLPTQPLSLVATASDVDVTLTWNAPANDGNEAITGYLIQRSTNGTTWTTIVANTNSTTRVYNDNNLAPGFTYYYRVAAINLVATTAGAGFSSPYSAVSSTPIAAASAGNALTNMTVTVANPEPNPLLFSDFGPGIRFTRIAVQYGSEFLYNEVEAKTQAGTAVLQVATAPDSQQLYGVRSYGISNLINSTDSGAFDVAKDYLTYYYIPQLRVDSITVDLSNLTIEEKLQVLDLEIDDYISISFTPNGIGDPKIQSGLVTGIAHRITITSHEVELRLRNERTLFTLDSDSKGILNVNILGP
jgi:predicted secreted protein